MICPDCRHDNIAGVDVCEACGQPLVEFDTAGSALEQSICNTTIEGLKPKTPVTVSDTDITRDVVSQMVDRNFGCLLVVDGGGQLVGVITERDVLYKLSGEPGMLDGPVSQVMTASPTTIALEDSIAYALHAMDLGGYRHMPIVDAAGQPAGIISIRDILGFVCQHFADPAPQPG